MITSQSIANIAPALLKAQKSMGDAVKGSDNPYYKSKYADLNAIREAVLPALNANDISVFQPMVYVGGKQFIETVFLHSSGESFSGLTEVVTPEKNTPQAAGSAISYARRYGLQSLANCGQVDDDGEAAMDRPKVKLVDPPKETMPNMATAKPSSFKPKAKEAPKAVDPAGQPVGNASDDQW